MSNIDFIEISLVIDDNTTLTFKLNSSQTDNDSLLKLSNDVAQKYNLPDKAKSKLHQCLINEVSRVLNNQTISSTSNTKNNSSIKEINEHVVNRLYYQSTQKKKERDEYHKQIRDLKNEEEMIQCSFTPNINKKSNLIVSNRNNKESIGDKLYSQRKNKNIPGNTIIAIKYSNNNNNGNNGNNIYNDEEKYINDDFDINDIVNLEEEKQIKNNNNQKTNNNLNVHPSHKTKSTQSVCAFNTISPHNRNEIEKSFNNNNFSKRIFPNSTKNIVRTKTNSSNINNNKCYERLYSYHKQKHSNRLQQQNEYFEEHYTFEPVISKGSQHLMRNRNESSDQFYSRLSSNKNLTKQNITKSNQFPSKRRAQSSYKTTSSHKTILTDNEVTPSYMHKRNLNEIKSEEKLYKNIQQVQNDRKKCVQYYQQNVNSHIERYKLNQLKDIYDLLLKDGDNKINFENLYKENIPNHIIDKVVKPACYMINDRNIEFNFENFFLIAGELLNKFFI